MTKKRNIWVSPLIIMGVLLILTSSCKKDENNDNPPANTVTDIDGNVYQTVTIGTQVWLAENLQVTHYRNGDSIPNVTGDIFWKHLTTGAYCNYYNDANNVTTYGRLYNWFTVNDSRNIAPTGWHVPTDAEWMTLTTYLGGASGAGVKLRETGTTHWHSPNTGATNETGFTALPGGDRWYWDASFRSIGIGGAWWSSTEDDENYAFYRSIGYSHEYVYRNANNKVCGLSVRLVKD